MLDLLEGTQLELPMVPSQGLQPFSVVWNVVSIAATLTSNRGDRLLKIAIELMSFPIKSGGSFHSYNSYVSFPKGLPFVGD